MYRNFKKWNVQKFQEVECTEISRSGMYRNQDYLPINPKHRRKSTQKIQKSKKIHESKNLEENSKIEENPKIEENSNKKILKIISKKN